MVMVQIEGAGMHMHEEIGGDDVHVHKKIGGDDIDSRLEFGEDDEYKSGGDNACAHGVWRR